MRYLTVLGFLLIAPFLGFSQTNSTQKVCVVVKETLMGKVVCFVLCNTNKGGGK